MSSTEWQILEPQVMELVMHGELFHCIRPNKGMKEKEVAATYAPLISPCVSL